MSASQAEHGGSIPLTRSIRKPPQPFMYQRLWGFSAVARPPSKQDKKAGFPHSVQVKIQVRRGRGGFLSGIAFHKTPVAAGTPLDGADCAGQAGDIIGWLTLYLFLITYYFLRNLVPVVRALGLSSLCSCFYHFASGPNEFLLLHSWSQPLQ